MGYETKLTLTFVVKLKTFDPEVVQHYRDQASIFAKRGYRSLGVAIKEDGKDWELLGISKEKSNSIVQATGREADT